MLWMGPMAIWSPENRPNRDEGLQNYSFCGGCVIAEGYPSIFLAHGQVSDWGTVESFFGGMESRRESNEQSQ